jgi:hypothetical protein
MTELFTPIDSLKKGGWSVCMPTYFSLAIGEILYGSGDSWVAGPYLLYGAAFGPMKNENEDKINS